jgi:hypothetical protein
MPRRLAGVKGELPAVGELARCWCSAVGVATRWPPRPDFAARRGPVWRSTWCARQGGSSGSRQRGGPCRPWRGHGPPRGRAGPHSGALSRGPVVRDAGARTTPATGRCIPLAGDPSAGLYWLRKRCIESGSLPMTAQDPSLAQRDRPEFLRRYRSLGGFHLSACYP